MKVEEAQKLLAKMVKLGHGDEDLMISMPYEDNMGFYYAGAINITAHEGIIDIAADNSNIRNQNDIASAAAVKAKK